MLSTGKCCVSDSLLAVSSVQQPLNRCHKYVTLITREINVIHLRKTRWGQILGFIFRVEIETIPSQVLSMLEANARGVLFLTL